MKEKELFFSDNCIELDEILSQTEIIEKDKKIDFIIIDKLNEVREYKPENTLVFEKLKSFCAEEF